MGLPCPSFVLGNTQKSIMKMAKATLKLDKVREVLYLRNSETLKKQEPIRKELIEKVIALPSIEPVFVRMNYYKKGQKNFNEPFTYLVQSLDYELQEQI